MQSSSVRRSVRLGAAHYRKSASAQPYRAVRRSTFRQGHIGSATWDAPSRHTRTHRSIVQCSHAWTRQCTLHKIRMGPSQRTPGGSTLPRVRLYPALSNVRTRHSSHKFISFHHSSLQRLYAAIETTARPHRSSISKC